MSKQDSTALSKEDITALRNLQPGTVVDVQVETPVSPQRLKTQYIGMNIGEACFFEIPNTHKWANVRGHLTPGSEVVVRFIIEGGFGEVIAFKASVLMAFSKPVAMFLTTFPVKIQKLGLRSDRRAQPGIPVSVYTDSEEKERVRGLMVDVSKTGCKLAINKETPDLNLEVNKNITLGCKLDGDAIRIESKIKNVAEVKGYIYYGIQFTGEPEVAETLIKRYILAL